MKGINKIGHPIFILSVFTLILNDWWFKTTFHNEFTGKISDFAGLFALPFLFSALVPRQTMQIHILTGLLFVFWKSDNSQLAIDIANSFGLPIHRTIDFSDNIALFSIPLSYLTLKDNYYFELKSILQKAIICISCLAFMATSMAPRDNRKFVNINKEYSFGFSRRELISRLNMVQIEEVRKLNSLSGQVDFNSNTNVFHYHGQTDTLALLLDYKKMQDKDTIVFKSSFAEILISGTETNSKLKLLTVYKIVPAFSDKDYRDKAIKQFERRIVKRIQNYR